ncbi:MAG: hypothetical protein GEV08_07710 [Acidimicrobiia bacterium]|nr:hypothetical protein [Acidimicrobiia bacterium]
MEERPVSHMVIYRSADGKPKYQQVDDLQAAVSFVEKIRNEDGLEGTRIFRLEQVNFRFEPYYQVRVETAGQQQAPVPPPPPVTVPAGVPAPPTDSAAAPPPEAPAPAPAAPIDLTTPTPAPAPATSPASSGEAPSAPEPAVAAEESTETNGVRRGLFGR